MSTLLALLLSSFFLFTSKNFSLRLCVMIFMYLENGCCVICSLGVIFRANKTYGVKIKLRDLKNDFEEENCHFCKRYLWFLIS